MLSSHEILAVRPMRIGNGLPCPSAVSLDLDEGAVVKIRATLLAPHQKMKRSDENHTGLIVCNVLCMRRALEEQQAAEGSRRF